MKTDVQIPSLELRVECQSGIIQGKSGNFVLFATSVLFHMVVGKWELSLQPGKVGCLRSRPNIAKFDLWIPTFRISTHNVVSVTVIESQGNWNWEVAFGSPSFLWNKYPVHMSGWRECVFVCKGWGGGRLSLGSKWWDLFVSSYISWHLISY